MELRGDGVSLVVEQVDEDTDQGTPPGVFVQVSNTDEGQASLVLDREDVMALVDQLGEWLVETEPDPDIPGRPV